MPREIRYRLGAEIARGGLGRVVEAWDSELKREVAVKLVLDGLPAELHERFLREAEITARLEHPNVVPVHGLLRPEDGSPPLLAMKRIRGRDLATLLRDLSRGDPETARTYSRPRLLRLFQDICLGIAYAHSRGVIHRDLKPSNVMVGDFGETLIVDWGLARERGSGPGAQGPEERRTGVSGTAATVVPVHGSGSSAMTMEGDVIGTPAYMPPEQAEGRVGELDERSDTYALGAILYEILTLRPAVEGQSLEEVIRNVRSGRIERPATRIARAVGSAAGASDSREPIQPELDAIVMKALALRREDRFQSARELHDEIQLFLEGVKERERRRREARVRVEEGWGHAARYRELAGAIRIQAAVVKELTTKLPPHLPLEEKRLLWEAQGRLRELEQERIEAFAKAHAAFGQARAADAECAEAWEGPGGLFAEAYLEAEARRDRREMLLNRNLLAGCDPRGTHAARLEAPGTLALRTFVMDCGCLRPVKHNGWKVESADRCTVPWREGRPRPDVPLDPDDAPVPCLRIRPEGARWGHSATCVPREVTGVPVSISRYEEKDRRLIPGPERSLGTTPLSGIVLPRGSWLCTVHPVGAPPIRVPVRIDRGDAWKQNVTLHDVPAGFCPVAGGLFLFGGEYAGAPPETIRCLPDFFMARFPVTFTEYLEFLNALAGEGRAAEARARLPRSSTHLHCAGDGPFRLATAIEDPEDAPDEAWAVRGVSWHDALAYAAWRSGRDGVLYSLPHEQEFEKAARGVDGRVYPWGEEWDGTFSHTDRSLAGRARPLPPGSFPADESPYGVRDLAGGMQTWCLNAGELRYRHFAIIRGGSWTTGPDTARSPWRLGSAPENVGEGTGIRLVMRPSFESHP